ncbi:twin-arginine translocase subunit TatC [Adhaeribacter pallidiroseus]|uniref:Sec-independent protein translocase protein TatC n=1 Tax=Adhaeribacter pallidiroseus TaxID=2072847 RepID=A0A369QR73_9BACT|nr:Sec-independent protein translocase protein TatC [Adhaeribacter pallidiroseus]
MEEEVVVSSGEHEMSFIDHLEELRWHLIRSVASILVFATGAFLSKDFIFHDLILGPSRADFFTYRKLCELGAYLGRPEVCIDKISFTLQSREMSSQFTTHMTVSAIIGLVLAFPYTFWEIWRFIKPGLYEREQKNSRGAVFFVSLLFFTGTLFGYFIAAPLSINFLASYQVDPSILNEFDLASYISTLTTMTFSCALMFELPMIVFFLAKAGLVSPEIMKLYRRHAIVVILIIAAVISPPDVMSMMLIAIPLLLLYEVSIYIAKAVRKKDIDRLNDELTS